MGAFQGRKKIFSEFKTSDMSDFQNVVSMVNNALVVHSSNKTEIDFLINYHKGDQPILEKVKEVRPEINNILLVNHAQRITRTSVGYFLGTPIQYIDRKGEKRSEIDDLNEILDYEDKASVDKEIGDYQSITGTAYRIIYTDNDDEIPFEERALNPSDTFVIYENTISEKPLAGVTYRDIYDGDGKLIGYDFYIYTEIGSYLIRCEDDMVLRFDDVYDFTSYNVGGVPIIEYPNNAWRIGDWEFALSIMDNINSLYSGRLDDIDQLVQALLVFINAEIDSETYAEMREAGAVMLKNSTNEKVDVKTITNVLDQGGMNLFSKELESLLDSIVGVPSRNERSGGGGDTGQAVELRDGWADLELVARNKELTFKKSEKKSLKIILSILNSKLGMGLKVRDIDIKFTRNKNNNLLVKTQSYSTLVSTETISPADALSIVDLVTGEQDYIDRGEEYWGGRREELNTNGNGSNTIEND